jgi:hypothetical protein
MKLTKSKLKEIIKEEILNEQVMDFRSVFYSLGDAIENLDWVNSKTNHPKDKQIETISKQMMKLQDKLNKHLDKAYEGWD